MDYVILLEGEYCSMDFMLKHNDGKHTLEEWEELIKESEEYREQGMTYVIREFETFDERQAYIKAIHDCENYLSSDFYTFVPILV